MVGLFCCGLDFVGGGLGMSRGWSGFVNRLVVEAGMVARLQYR